MALLSAHAFALLIGLALAVFLAFGLALLWLCFGAHALALLILGLMLWGSRFGAHAWGSRFGPRALAAFAPASLGLGFGLAAAWLRLGFCFASAFLSFFLRLWLSFLLLC